MKQQKQKNHKGNKTAVLRGRVPEDLKSRVLTLAEKRQTSEGAIVREAVVNFLTKHCPA